MPSLEASQAQPDAPILLPHMEVIESQSNEEMVMEETTRTYYPAPTPVVDIFVSPRREGSAIESEWVTVPSPPELTQVVPDWVITPSPTS